jgi:hypothetical protein
MGLDQYALSRAPKEPKFKWRKHPNLQGWMERLWERRGNEGTFNMVELRLDKEDIQELMTDVMTGDLSGGEDTEGFFFGGNSDEHYRDQDLEFCKWALEELDKGNEVIYDSWW